MSADINDTIVRVLVERVMVLERHVMPSPVLTPNEAEVLAWVEDRSAFMRRAQRGDRAPNVYERALDDMVRLGDYLNKHGWKLRADERAVDMTIRIINELAAQVVTLTGKPLVQTHAHTGANCVGCDEGTKGGP